MDKYFSFIASQLKSLGIILKKDSIDVHKHQGFMSDVYKADSSEGKLIIHLSTISPEQNRQKVWDKVHALSDFLQVYQSMPVAKVFASGQIDDKYFLVQEMLAGSVAGKGEIIKDIVVDTWYNESAIVKEQIEEISSIVNNIKMSGFGWLSVEDGQLKGQYKSWLDFLEHEVDLWYKHIKNMEPNSSVADNLKNYFEEIKNKLSINDSFLVHGDLINPSNILVSGNKVTGLLDWEWAMAGDPAWDFAFNSKYDFKNYFTNQDQEHFLRRISYYEKLYLMWGIYMHSSPDKDKIYKALRNHLTKLGF